MKRYVWLWAVLFGVAGCALPLHTQGVVGPVTWTTSAFDLHSGSALSGDTDRFSFTLDLQETQGLSFNFTSITWEVQQKGVDLSGRQTRTGAWTLPANGALRQPFVYRIFCPSSDYCPDVGPTTQWDISFEGTDGQGQTIHVVVRAELPWIPPRGSEFSPASKPGPWVELAPIDVTVPRLYFPRFGND